jgi:hypothetical protein
MPPNLLHFLPCSSSSLARRSHSYAQLVESFRNESGKPRQRTVATIGRIDDAGGAVDLLLKGLIARQGHALIGG